MSILQISNSPHRPQVPSQIPGLKSYAVHVPPALCVRVPCTWASFGQRHTLFLYSLFCCSSPLLTPILSRPMFFPFPLPPTSQIFSFLQDPAQGHHRPPAPDASPLCPPLPLPSGGNAVVTFLQAAKTLYYEKLYVCTCFISSPGHKFLWGRILLCVFSGPVLQRVGIH